MPLKLQMAPAQIPLGRRPRGDRLVGHRQMLLAPNGPGIGLVLISVELQSLSFGSQQMNELPYFLLDRARIGPAQASLEVGAASLLALSHPALAPQFGV